MKKIILHVGYPKCASTSLQAALYGLPNITYPRRGLNLHEHLAVPLKLKGLDAWTAKWFSQEWVDSEFEALIQEVKSASGVVVISSERLADITPSQIDELMTCFGNVEMEALVLYRPKDDFVRSMWRHEVFRHDLAEPFDVFNKRFVEFNMLSIVPSLESRIKVNLADISSHSLSDVLSGV